MATTITLPTEEHIDEVSANLTDAALVAQAGVAQVEEIASGRFKMAEPPTLSQLGALHILATDLEHDGKAMMTAAHRLREALVALDGFRREDGLRKGGGEEKETKGDDPWDSFMKGNDDG